MEQIKKKQQKTLIELKQQFAQESTNCKLNKKLQLFQINLIEWLKQSNREMKIILNKKKEISRMTSKNHRNKKFRNKNKFKGKSDKK